MLFWIMVMLLAGAGCVAASAVYAALPLMIGSLRASERYDPQKVASMEEELKLSIPELAERRGGALSWRTPSFHAAMEEGTRAMDAMRAIHQVNEGINRQLQSPEEREIRPGFARFTGIYVFGWFEIDEARLRRMLRRRLQGSITTTVEDTTLAQELDRRLALGWQPFKKRAKKPSLAPHRGDTVTQ